VSTGKRTTKRLLIAQPPDCSIDVVVGFDTRYGGPSVDVSITEQIGRGKGHLSFDKWWASPGSRYRLHASGPGIEASIEMFEAIAAALRELRDEHKTEVK
jgi:hypothetical protein